MDHDPPPEVTATRWLPRLAQRLGRWLHFRRWDYGACNGRRARRSRINGNVQFVLWRKGHVLSGAGDYDAAGNRLNYVYPSDWWHDFDSSWWPKFKKDQKCKTSE